MSKKSIRFFNDREVRAVWDEEHSKWWFSATDIVRAINNEDDYKKCRNYWKYLKGKFAKDGIQLVSVTNHFKFEAPDGKQRFADALDAECVQTVAQHYPNNRANAFLSWITSIKVDFPYFKTVFRDLKTTINNEKQIEISRCISTAFRF